MVQQLEALEPETGDTQDAARIALGLMLMTAGTSHLTFAREPLKAQVPPWVPLEQRVSYSSEAQGRTTP